MNQWKVVAAFLLLCAGSLRAENPKFHPLTDGGIGLARYRVAIDFSTAADPDTFVRQLLATCRCRQEPYAELGFEGVMIVATPAAAELLSRDARVVTVEEVPPLPAPAPPPASRTASAPSPSSTGETTTISVAPAVPAMTAVSSEAQLVVPSPTTDSTVFWSRTYGYDKSGNVVTAGSDKYAYDRLGRVTYADAGQAKNQKYTYDRYGNLLTIIENGNTSATVDLRPDPATNRISGNGNVIAAYDTAGRMTSATGLIAKYDGEDTVVESTIQNGTTVRRVHLYSAAGERVATLTVNNSGHELSSAWTIRDPAGKVLRRLTRTNGLPGSWRWDEDYIYRDGQMLAAEVDTPARTLHYHLDHLGTPRVITGNGGAVVGQHTYHAFGKEATDPVQEGEAQKFTGHERDAEFLDYMHARYYNAYWGRFLSVDPGRFDPNKPQTWNRYIYANNNPLSNIDPDGREPNKADATNINGFLANVRRIERENPGAPPALILAMAATRLEQGNDAVSYLYTTKRDWIDSKHFFAAANTAESFGEGVTLFLGLGVEAKQVGTLSPSGFSYEDLPSNAAGADFGDDHLNGGSLLSQQIETYLNAAGATEPSAAPNYQNLPDTKPETGSRPDQSSDSRHPAPKPCEQPSGTSASGC